MISITKDLNSRVFTVSISGSERNLVKNIAEVLIEELNIIQKQYNRNKMSETRQFIENRIEAIKVELEMAEENLKKFFRQK